MDLARFENENIGHEKSRTATLNRNFFYDCMLEFTIIFCYLHNSVPKFMSNLCTKSLFTLADYLDMNTCRIIILQNIIFLETPTKFG